MIHHQAENDVADILSSSESTDVSPCSRKFESAKAKTSDSAGDTSGDKTILTSDSINLAPIDSKFVVSALHDVDSDTEDLELPHLEVLRISRKDSKSDILAPAKDFSDVSNVDTIKTLCLKHVEGWQKLQPSDLVVDQLMAGLSNQLFKVSLTESLPDRFSFDRREVLFRIYGKDVEALYDSATEVQVFKTLSKHGFAPQYLGGFQGGRIEEWIYGAVLVTKDMMLKTTMVGVATVLAAFHEIDLSSVVSTEPVVFRRLKSWSNTAWNLYKSLPPSHPNALKIERLDIQRLMKEVQKFPSVVFGSPMTLDQCCAALEARATAEDGNTKPALSEFKSNILTEVALCHNDVQENNVMVTATPAGGEPRDVSKSLDSPKLHSAPRRPEFYVRLIDFEYSAYSYPACDIASYFWETMCDYNYKEYPFYKITPEDYPSEIERCRFIALYLSHRLRKHVSFRDKAYLEPFLATVERFLCVNDLLWGFWSIIRAGQAPTGTTEFDMLLYAKSRFDHYWDQKKLLGLGD